MFWLRKHNIIGAWSKGKRMLRTGVATLKGGRHVIAPHPIWGGRWREKASWETKWLWAIQLRLGPQKGTLIRGTYFARLPI